MALFDDDHRYNLGLPTEGDISYEIQQANRPLPPPGHTGPWMRCVRGKWYMGPDLVRVHGADDLPTDREIPLEKTRTDRDNLTIYRTVDFYNGKRAMVWLEW